ncbi:MAG: hypothetical protein JO360_10160 [Acidobacteria bacterium]|nr:hypothetical protein [Acidobacteriota bacterium]
MKRSTKRWVGITAVALGALGATGAVLIRMKNFSGKIGGRRETKPLSVWARPGMQVTFRAELMPGRDASERVFRVKELLPSGRVLLHDFAGEHNEKEFEQIR